MNFINIYSHISVKPTTDICIIYLTLFAVALLFTFIYFFLKNKFPSLYEPRSLAIRVFPIFNCAYIILNNHSYSPFISAISEM